MTGGPGQRLPEEGMGSRRAGSSLVALPSCSTEVQVTIVLKFVWRPPSWPFRREASEFGHISGCYRHKSILQWQAYGKIRRNIEYLWHARCLWLMYRRDGAAA
jgi:hypothetical protein